MADAFTFANIKIITSMKIPVPLLIIIFSSGCGHPSDKKDKALDKLDAFIKQSDSSYHKPYYRTDFVTAWYYINKKDSAICQVMKDSAQNIRQVVIAKKNVRTFFASFHPNGQLQADLSLDEFGQYHGNATYYYASGRIESTGNYEHGIKTGSWEYFDEKGRLLSTDKYDKSGQLIK